MRIVFIAIALAWSLSAQATTYFAKYDGNQNCLETRLTDTQGITVVPPDLPGFKIVSQADWQACQKKLSGQ